MNKSSIVPIETVSQKIFIIRGVKVMLDVDPAELYQVDTKVLNQSVKRNRLRFPGDFTFQLTEIEKAEVVTNCDHLAKLKFSHQLPYAFTEHGIAMLSAVLKSKRAVKMSLFIVRAFIKMREMLSTHKDLAEKIADIEREQSLQNKHINAINLAIGRFIDEPVEPKAGIGFSKGK